MTYRKKSSFFVMCLIFLSFFSCGLSVYYFIEPSYNVATPSPDNPSNNYFTFSTADIANNEQSDTGEITYFGTDVYYKIYNNLNTLTSNTSAINTTNTEYTENGFNKMYSYGYQQLRTSRGILPAIPNAKNISGAGFSNWSVNIRLTKEGVYRPLITLVNNITTISDIIPYRFDESNFIFSQNYTPTESDMDYQMSTEFTTENTWYVNAYAVSTAMDTTLSTVHSQLCYLGYVKIQRQSN